MSDRVARIVQFIQTQTKTSADQSLN